MTTTTALPDDGFITLVSWPDALSDATGHPVRSEYVERFWLGILGPTATWLLRRCSDEVQANPTGAVVDLHPMAGSIGLAYHAGRPNPFSRGFDRLIMFGMMRHVGNHPRPTFAVRTRVPPLAGRQLARLPEQLQVAHADFLMQQHGDLSATH
ncbi:MAG: hypothetical protein RL573_909 [Actinomycetota bacterium]|jgi:hypothetical protein